MGSRRHALHNRDPQLDWRDRLTRDSAANPHLAHDLGRIGYAAFRLVRLVERVEEARLSAVSRLERLEAEYEATLHGQQLDLLDSEAEDRAARLRDHLRALPDGPLARCLGALDRRRGKAGAA